MGSLLNELPVRAQGSRRGGFSLLELLVVLAIFSILATVVLLSLPAQKGARDVENGIYSIQDALEQARTFAMSGSTYAWVGFFEESSSSPGVSGTGQIVISIIAAANGANLLPAGASLATLPYSSVAKRQLVQVSKLIKVSNVHLAIVPSASPVRPAIAVTNPADIYQVGSTHFPNTTTFFYPLDAVAATAKYTFTQIIQFSPQGDATRMADYPTQLIEIGLQPTHGSSLMANANVAVIQIAGIGGRVTTYRP